MAERGWFVRGAFRVLAALITMALGGFLAVFGFILVWSVWAGFTGRPGGAANNYYYVKIGNVTLEGWKIYACAGTAVVMAVALIVLGLSLFPRRKADG